MMTPIARTYFRPRRRLLRYLYRCAARRWTIGIILPRKNDSLLVGAGPVAPFQQLLAAGVKVSISSKAGCYIPKH